MKIFYLEELNAFVKKFRLLYRKIISNKKQELKIFLLLKNILQHF
ncbi:hypothetical protein HMPREF1552_01417 [Leptotrichia sp. oral taxon 879 str. F0557]|nr:hypothetical protein HMPREF1552_01417 [Leptotrichia sp. oral taxon 879 str. F0557]